ncbi:MAG: IS66 family insertion sequence element accessory protein TnpB [Verrucomicrobiota bacterium]
MIGLANGLRVFVCTQPADMRRSFDGLSGMVANIVGQDPLSGHLFLFRNRNRDRLKILYWDRDGLAIWYKRLEKGTFQFPTDLIDKEKRSAGAEITTNQLSLLLGGIDLRSVERRKRYYAPDKPR